jgi:hypothetical protein
MHAGEEGRGEEEEELPLMGTKKSPRATTAALEKSIPVMEGSASDPSLFRSTTLWQDAQKCAATSKRVMVVGAGAATRKRPR